MPNGVPGAAILIGTAFGQGVHVPDGSAPGGKGHSPAIMASAQDNLADVISAGTGLVGVVAASWVHPLADPPAGLSVSVWIFRNAAGILVENIGYLTGRAAGPELFVRIYAAARNEEGVMGVHRVIAD